MFALCALRGFPFVCVFRVKIFGATPFWLGGAREPAPTIFVTSADIFVAQQRLLQ
jgi:hypothetical protein